MITVKFDRTLTNAYGFEEGRIMLYSAPTYVTINGEIYKDNIKIGEMTLYEIDGSLNFAAMSMQVPGDTGVIADVICNATGRLKYDTEKFVILDQIHIDPEYRNQGYGSQIMKGIMETLNDACNHTIDMMVLYASIFDIDEYIGCPIGKFEADVARLVGFYERAGFKHVENNVMIKMKG